MDPIIIVGTGMAGYSLAREFRKLDKSTPLIMISADDGRSYPKPLLSNALEKAKTAEQIVLADSSKMEKILHAKIITQSAVVQLNPLAHILMLQEGSQYHYKKCVLALGAHPIVLPVEGNATADVISINNLDDYALFRQKLTQAKHVALVGTGLIGCEFANDLSVATNRRVSLIGRRSLLMDAILPPEIAIQLQQHLTDAGVECHLAAEVKSINHNREGGYVLQLDKGTELYPDLLVSAIGLQANTALASQAGLAINQAIVTDGFLRTTQEDIYALGDCAEVEGHHLLYVTPLLACAKALAKTLAGEPTTVHYPAMPVTIKTSLYPIVVAPPPTDIQGEWVYESREAGVGIKALFMTGNNNLAGFALGGDAVAEKQDLAKQLPPLLH